jgi:hypothetical protein
VGKATKIPGLIVDISVKVGSRHLTSKCQKVRFEVLKAVFCLLGYKAV